MLTGAVVRSERQPLGLLDGARDVEPLVRRLDVVSQEIDDILGLVPSNSPADVIAARREARR
jgi:hypothetical protein